MTISAILTVTNPTERQDPWEAAIKSVIPLVDEIIIVNGGDDLGLDFRSDEIGLLHGQGVIKEIKLPWPRDWSWDELPKHLNAGLLAASGDWVIRLDADYVFKDNVREMLEHEINMLGETPVATMQKFSAVLSTKFYQKGGVKMVINRGKNKNVLFGRDKEKYTDLCVPIYWDMKSRDEHGVPVGQAIPDSDCGLTHVEFFNYDYTFKTKEFTADEFNRFSLAHKKYFGSTKWGETPEESLEVFLNMMRGRLAKCVYDIPHERQPSVIQSQLQNLTKDQFGHSGWGEL